MFQKVVYCLLSFLIGAIFLFSGYTKLYPIEPFEFAFVDTGLFNWALAPFVARMLIGLEFFLAVLFILNFKLKSIAYKLGFVILIFFCFYLTYSILTTGNATNCGCFGSVIIMTPLQALLKNSAMLIVLFILIKYHNGWNINNRAIVLLLFITSFGLPFVLNPIELNYSEAYLNKPTENFKLELDSLYANATVNVPPKSLSEGKHILAFMSLTCPHCKIAAKKMGIINKRNTAIPFYFVLNGDESRISTFLSETKTENIQHCMLLGKSFVYLAGTSFPTIYLINNSVVEHEINYINMDQSEIEKWLKN